MGDEVLFRKGLAAEILARAAGAANEVCGLLLGAPGHVTGVLHCRNVAADPAIAFEIDPSQLIAALRAARGGGPQVVGCYHSHPRGAAEPSARDAAEAAPNGWLWLIVAGQNLHLYRAAGQGTHGMFLEIPFSRSP